MMSDLKCQLSKEFSAAILSGDTNEAVKLAAKLSDMKVKLDITINKDEIEPPRNREQTFSVRVHVEDRLSDGRYFNLLVKSSDTIQDLKRMVMLRYNFPEEVQRWIIGKKLPENENKLSQCGVRGEGHTLYLYLVTARSVGLSKQEYETRRQDQGTSLLHKQPNQSGLHSPVQRDTPETYWPAPQSPLDTEAHNCSNNQSPVLSPSPDIGMGEVDQGHNSYGHARQTSKRSLTSGSSIIQEMLMASNLSSLMAADTHQKPVPAEAAANELEHWDNGYEVRPSRQPHRFTTPPPEIEKIGWVCPTCTFINLPIRPGCEMCTGPRPSGYKVPSGYQITTEERLLLENDQLLEKMTREAQPAAKHGTVPRALTRPNHRITYEQLKENLELIEALNTRASNNNSNINHRNSSGNNQIIGNDVTFIPGGSDWANIHEVPLPRQRPHQHHQSSHRGGSVVAPPPIENQHPRHSPSPNHTQRTARQSGYITPDSEDDIYNGIPVEDEYYSSINNPSGSH